MRRLIGWRLLPVTLCVAGVVLLGLSWLLQQRGWWSGVLTNAGTTVLLFAPLLLAGRSIERMLSSVHIAQELAAEKQQEIADRQQKTDSDVARLAEEVAETREDLRLTREQLSDTVLNRIADTREKDATLFESVAQMPSWEGVLNALCRALELKLISGSGCRVALFDTSRFLRFMAESSVYNGYGFPVSDPDQVILTLEHQDGTAISALVWEAEQSPVDVAMLLVEAMQSAGIYPGDAHIRIGDVFADLGKIFEVAHKRATGERGNTYSLGRLVQICPPQWAIADDGLCCIDPSIPYHVDAGKFFDESLREHMKEKVWVDMESFNEAYTIGRELYRNLKLDAKPHRIRMPDGPPA